MVHNFWATVLLSFSLVTNIISHGYKLSVYKLQVVYWYILEKANLFTQDIELQFLFLKLQANISVGSTFNFKKFLSRTYDEDFEKIVGTRYSMIR